MTTTTAILLSMMYYYTEGTNNDRARIQIHQNVIQDKDLKETNHEDNQQVTWIGFEIMAAIIGLSILYRAATSCYQRYLQRKEAEAEENMREAEENQREMEETIRLMVHILMQEKRTTRRQEDTYEDEPILATYERWDALTDRMNEMGLLTTC